MTPILLQGEPGRLLQVYLKAQLQHPDLPYCNIPLTPSIREAGRNIRILPGCSQPFPPGEPVLPFNAGNPWISAIGWSYIRVANLNRRYSKIGGMHITVIKRQWIY